MDRTRNARSVASRIAPLLAVVGLLAACGGDAAESAEAVIETELEEQIGLGELSAACNQPDDLAEGETFECTAVTEDGGTIQITGTMTSNDEFNVQTTNVLTEDDVGQIVPVIADAVSNEVGAAVTAADITCPSGTVILDGNGDFPCEIVDTTTGDVYELTIRTGGLTPDGPENLGFSISAEPIRS